MSRPQGRDSRSTSPPPGSDRAWVWGLAAVYALTFTFFSVVKYRYYLHTDFDFAIFVQATDRILHGSLRWHSVRSRCTGWPSAVSDRDLRP